MFRHPSVGSRGNDFPHLGDAPCNGPWRCFLARFYTIHKRHIRQSLARWAPIRQGFLALSLSIVRCETYHHEKDFESWCTPYGGRQSLRPVPVAMPVGRCALYIWCVATVCWHRYPPPLHSYSNLFRAAQARLRQRFRAWVRGKAARNSACRGLLRFAIDVRAATPSGLACARNIGRGYAKRRYVCP